MKIKFLRLFLLLSIVILFNSCGSLKEGFKNQKKNNSDEFLVEKKSPLVMPPDYGELPIPNADLINEDKEDKEDNAIKSLISTDKNGSESTENSNRNFEDILLKKIKNN